jgi:hypothetical protein
LVVSPSAATIYPSSSFTVLVTASTNSSSQPSLSSVALPAGITTTASFPLSIPSGGVSIHFQTSSGIAAGSYTLTFSGSVGSVSSTANLVATVQTNPPSFFFPSPLFSEIAVPVGGSSQVQVTTMVSGQAAYDVQLSLSGLPPGTSATINPSTVTVGQSATVTITAASTAHFAQNVSITLTGTPGAPVASASIGFLLNVTPKPGSLPNNRTDYVSTEHTPYAAVYDPMHRLIFASNDSWNRVEVISSTTHALVKRISIPEPRGIDITQDRSTVWVTTGSRQMFAINTTTFEVSRYLLPLGGNVSYWEGSQVFVLSNGSMMIVSTAGQYTGSFGILIWNPATNAINFPTIPFPLDNTIYNRSGDGKRAYLFNNHTGGGVMYYDVASQTFSAMTTLNVAGFSSAVNLDGSRFVLCSDIGYVYDGSFNQVGQIPFCGVGPAPFYEGGAVFSPDGKFIYEEFLGGIPLILKIDASSLNLVSTAPAMPMIPVMTELIPPYYVPNPFAVDDTGMVFGIEFWGIAFDDSTYLQNYSSAQPGTPVFLQHMDPYFGPLGGGTTSGGFGNAFSITPDVWYGPTRGTASLGSGGILTITSPASSMPGPVIVKMLFPDGIEVFDPLFFSYGPYLQYPLVSGGPPQGNVAGQVAGYGMPGDNITGTFSVGGAMASVTPPGPFGVPFAGTPYPNKALSYTVPPGPPGWADLKLTTPDGTSTLSHAFLYAKSLTDYSSTDTFTAVLYDQARRQLYLSAGDHIDVFSLQSNTFIAKWNPPATGSAKQFTGLALTPDGSLLLAADLLDGSLAVISPDNPATSFVIPVTPVQTGNPGCNIGPLYVEGLVNKTAAVQTGGLPSSRGGCPPNGPVYMADLTTHAVSALPLPSGGSIALSATDDGSKLAFGGLCVYDAVANSSSCSGAAQTTSAAISGDGHAVASEFVLADGVANVVGRVARPEVYYSALGSDPTHTPLLEPKLNDSGSLYYIAFPNFIDIVDFRQGMLRIRFSLSETISNTATPMAIDPTGRYLYLITGSGLTIIDLGEAPLSIGWLSAATASPGTQITVRGSGFNTSTTATVGGQIASVNPVDANTLKLTVPALGAGPTTIVFSNSDGQTYTATGLLTIP